MTSFTLTDEVVARVPVRHLLQLYLKVNSTLCSGLVMANTITRPGNGLVMAMANSFTDSNIP